MSLLKKYNSYFFIVVLAFSFLAGGCSKNLYTQGRKLAEEGNFSNALEKYEARVLKKPQDFKAWRELGVARYELGDYQQAIDALNNAEEIKADSRSRYFIGIIFEKLKEYEKARDAYSSALQIESSEKISKRVIQRLDLLAIRLEVGAAIAAEKSINADSIPQNTIAVYDFDGSALDPELAPVALGLSEFTAIDLSKIKALTVVERAKLHLLLAELKRSEETYIDKSSAPKIGRILGSRNIVTATLTSPELNHLRLSGIIVNTVDSSEYYPESSESVLKKIFEMQKQFVREILTELNIELTPEEQDSLNIVPTDSYEAFLAYCKGLTYQKAGHYEEALEEFRRASNIDNRFFYAQDQLEFTAILVNEQEFENFIQSETIGGLTDLETTLGNVLENTGSITPPAGGEEQAQQPPVIPTGSVRVKGTIGGD